MTESGRFRPDLQHDCAKKPQGEMFSGIEREAGSGEWWVTGVSGHAILGIRQIKIRRLQDGICPWCNANLTRLAAIWPHTCPKEGENAKEFISKAAALDPQSVHEQVRIKLEIDPDNPTQAVYQVTITQTHEVTVTKCPDCGVDLF